MTLLLVGLGPDVICTGLQRNMHFHGSWMFVVRYCYLCLNYLYTELDAVSDVRCELGALELTDLWPKRVLGVSLCFAGVL